MMTWRNTFLTGLVLSVWIISWLAGAGCRSTTGRNPGEANLSPSMVKTPTEPALSATNKPGFMSRHFGSKTNQPAMGATPAPRIEASMPPASVRSNTDTTFTPYRIQASDTLLIALRGITPEQPSIELVVDENGEIRLPYINDIKAAGKTTSELENIIRDAYLTQKIYKHLTVNVIVPSQTAPTFYIKGEVRSPGRIPYVNGMTVLSAVAAAGGPTDFASSDLMLLRGSKRVKLNYSELEKHPERDQPIQAGDIVILERSWF